MFSVMPPSQQFPFTFEAPSSHRPVVSSPLSSSPLRASSPPLSPLDPNVRLRPRQTQSSPITGNVSAVKPIPFAFSTRQARPNPLVQKREDAREGKRKLFLQNVRQRAEDKNWERRGGENEVLRLEWSRLNRELHQAKERDQEGMVREEELDDALQMQQSQHPTMDVDLDDQMIDALEHEEEAELDALMSSIPDSSSMPSELDPPFFSDDDIYDDIFNDFIQQDQHMSPSEDVEMA